MPHPAVHACPLVASYAEGLRPCCNHRPPLYLGLTLPKETLSTECGSCLLPKPTPHTFPITSRTTHRGPVHTTSTAPLPVPTLPRCIPSLPLHCPACLCCSLCLVLALGPWAPQGPSPVSHAWRVLAAATQTEAGGGWRAGKPEGELCCVRVSCVRVSCVFVYEGVGWGVQGAAGWGCLVTIIKSLG